MKIDDGYLRGILEAFEAAEGPTTDIRDLESRGYDCREAICDFHLQIAYDRGLIESTIPYTIGKDVAADGAVMWSVIPLRLTANGHEFLRELRENNVSVLARDGGNTMKHQRSEIDFFISHASEDKDSFVRPLAVGLIKANYTVWYDETTLTLGDSLRRRIDEGLARCRFGVVVLSHAFFNKEWPQKELDGLVAREDVGKQVILPIWHNITHEQIANYSPTLADRVGVSSDKGLPHVIVEIERAFEEHYKRTGDVSPHPVLSHHDSEPARPKTASPQAMLLLEALYQRDLTESQPAFVVELGPQIGLSEQEAQAAWRYLKDKHLIQTFSLHYTARINAYGKDLIESGSPEHK
jgi:hypothetical protein